MAFSFENLLSAEERTKLRGQVRELSKVNPTLQLGYFLLDWALIIATIVFAHHFFLTTGLCRRRCFYDRNPTTRSRGHGP